MGPPPRSLTAEANSCFMVRVLHGPNRIQGCGASIAPERGLPSDQLYRTSNNEGHRVAVTLDTKVLIQGCVKTPTFSLRVEIPSRFRKFENQKCLRPLLREDDRENNSAHSWLVHVFTQPGSSTDVTSLKCDVRCSPESRRGSVPHGQANWVNSSALVQVGFSD